MEGDLNRGNYLITWVNRFVLMMNTRFLLVELFQCYIGYAERFNCMGGYDK